MSDFVMVSGATPQHDRVSDYEPTEMTSDELKRAGLTLVGVDSALLYLKCDKCDEQWATGKNLPALTCPNTRDDGEIPGALDA